MRLIPLLVFVLALGLRAEDAPVVELSDLPVQDPAYVDPLARDVASSTETLNSNDFQAAQKQRVEETLSASEEVFRHALRLNNRRFGLRGSVNEYAMRRLEANRSTIVIVPFGAEIRSKALVAFTRKLPITSQRVALLADGSIVRVENTAQLHALIASTLRNSHCTIELRRDCTPEEERNFLEALAQLTHEDFDQREAASARLREAGLKALPLLTLGAKSADPERRERCRDALVRLDRFYALRSYVVDLRNELGLPEIPDTGKPIVPETVRVAGEIVIVGNKEFPLALLRDSFPDIYGNLIGGE